MTVGGRIWHVEDDAEARLVLVNGAEGESTDWLFLRLVKGPEPLKRGDSIWWQGFKAYWTPEPMREQRDVPIKRIGYSFSAPEEMRRVMNERTSATVS